MEIPDNNTVRLYNESGGTQNLKLNVITDVTGGSGVSLAPSVADVDSGTGTSSIFINKTGGAGNFIQFQVAGTDVFTLDSDGDIETDGRLTFSDNGAYVDVSSNDMIFYDPSYGSTVTLSQLAAGGSGGYWTQGGTDLYYNTGNVGVGTASPETSFNTTGDVQLGVTDGTRYVNFDNGTANNAGIRYNSSSDKMQFSHDGLVWSDMGSGSGGNAFFTNTDAAVAGGSYLDVVHNQGTLNVISTAWVHNGTNWVEIDDLGRVSHNIYDPNLIGWYKAEESSGDLDNAEGTSSRDLIDKGSPTYSQTGEINNAIDLDGSSAYFCTGSGTTCADKDNFDFGDGSFTIGGWFKHDTIVTNPDYLATKYDSTASANTGTGADGAISLTTGAHGTTPNINATAFISGRSCADSPTYNVSALTATSATVTAALTTDCLVAGDEIMLINLQGTASNTTNLGNYEFLRVAAGSSGTTVNFTTSKTKYYGSTAGSDAGLGSTDSTQRVMLMRVPNYTNVTIGSGVSFLPSAYGGAKNGVIAFRATGTVSITGVLGYSGGRGYAGGSGMTAAYQYGYQGASTTNNAVSQTYVLRAVGGGGGGYNCNGGAGGGHASAGAYGQRSGSACGGGTPQPGGAYGGSTSATLTLGSGGGEGGYGYNGGWNYNGGNGGRGGGITYVGADTIVVNGYIDMGGGNGGNTSNSDIPAGGGGGGAGGTVMLVGRDINLGAARTLANAGARGTSAVTTRTDTWGNETDYAHGGAGGIGRVFVEYVDSIIGTSSPGASSSQITNSAGGYKLYMNPAGDLVFGIDDDENSFPEDSATTATNPYDDNAWHHIAAVKNEQEFLKIYVDGEEVAADYDIVSNLSTSNDNPFYLGVDSNGSSNPWDGSLDEFFVYSRPLEAGEVEELYQANAKFKIEVADNNTVRLHNESSTTQNLKLNVITSVAGGSGVSLSPTSADVDADASEYSIFVNRTGSGGGLMKLQADGSDAFLIERDGSAAIGGLSSTEQALDVNGNIQLGQSDGDRYIYFDNGTANNAGIRYNSTTDAVQYSHDGSTWADIGSGGTNYWTQTGSDIYYNGGNVGIGTTNPQAKLDIGGASSTISNDSGDITINSASGNVSFSGDSFTNVLNANFSGNVGIGTSTPTTALDIGTGIASLPAIRETTGAYQGTDISHSSPSTTHTAQKLFFHVPGTGNSPAKYMKIARLKITNTYSNWDVQGWLRTSGGHTGYERMANLSFGAYTLSDATVAVEKYSKWGENTENIFVYKIPNGDGSNHAYYDIYVKAGWYDDTTGELTFSSGHQAASATIWQAGLDSGTSAPTDTLVNPTTNQFVFESGNVGIADTTPTYKLDVNGTIRGFGITDSSDVRLKQEITNIDPVLDRLLQVRGVNYHWIDQDNYGSNLQTGFIAQELEQQFPDLVSTDTEGYKSIAYGKMTAVLVEAIKEQQDILGPININGEGFLTINGDSVNGYGLAYDDGTTQGPIDAVAGFAKAKIADLTAGVVRTRDLIADNITISGQSLSDYITNIVDNRIAETPPSSDLVEDADLSTIEITDIDTGDAILDIDNNGNISTLGNINSEGTSSLGSLIVTEDATISGTLAVENIEVESSRVAYLEGRIAEFEDVKALTAEIGEATFSGTLYADDIYNFDQMVADAFQQPSLMATIMGDVEQVDPFDGFDLSTADAQNLNLTIADLDLAAEDVVIAPSAVFINDYLKVNGSGYIAGSLGVAENLLVGDGIQIGNGAIAYKPTNALDNTFYIQPDGTGTLSFMANLMTLSQDGIVTISGDLRVAGDIDVAGELKVETSLLTNLIKPLDSNAPVQLQLAEEASMAGEVNNSRFEIVDELGTPVATISAAGKADFAGGVGVESGDISLSSPGIFVTTKTAGKAYLPAGSSQVIIRSEDLTEDTLIYVTPLGSTNNQVLYVKNQVAENKQTTVKEGNFVVGLDFSLTEDVEFNWWMVQ